MRKVVLVSITVLLVSGFIFASCAAPTSTPQSPIAPLSPTSIPTASPSPTSTPTAVPSPTSKPTAASPIELKAVSFLPSMTPTTQRFIEFINGINNKTQGGLKITFLGGPEVIGQLQQPQAVKTGVVQMVMTAGAFYKSMLPEVLVFHLSKLSVKEERESGFYDYMVERHKQTNMYYLGRAGVIQPFYVYTKSRVAKPADLKGLKIAQSGAIGIRFLQAFGVNVVIMDITEYYTSIERGVVNGVIYPLAMVDLNLHEVLKYIIVHPVYMHPSILHLVNLDAWNKIPANLQKVMLDDAIEWEGKMETSDQVRAKAYLEKMQKAGMESLEFSSADAKEYTDVAYQVEWDQLKKDAPDLYLKLRQLLREQ